MGGGSSSSRPPPVPDPAPTPTTASVQETREKKAALYKRQSSFNASMFTSPGQATSGQRAILGG
jgi:hypothetical protein